MGEENPLNKFLTVSNIFFSFETQTDEVPYQLCNDSKMDTKMFLIEGMRKCWGLQ